MNKSVRFIRVKGRIVPIVNDAKDNLKNIPNAFKSKKAVSEAAQKASSVRNAVGKQIRTATAAKQAARTADFSAIPSMALRQKRVTNAKAYTEASRKLSRATNRFNKLTGVMKSQDELLTKISKGRKGLALVAGAIGITGLGVAAYNYFSRNK